MSLNENPARPGEPKVSSFNDTLKRRRMGTPADERLRRAELFPSEQKKKKSELRVNDGGYTLRVCLLQVREVFKQIARVKRTEGEMLRLLILDSIKSVILSQGGFALALIQNRKICSESLLRIPLRLFFLSLLLLHLTSLPHVSWSPIALWDSHSRIHPSIHPS